MTSHLKSSAEKVQKSLREAGFRCEVKELQETARSAQEAADTIGCSIEQIVKSLVFMGKETGHGVLVLASGPNRVDLTLIREKVEEKLLKANADFVREWTGFAIGGVPPIAHAKPMRTYIDQSLMNLEVVWAAAGHPHAVFCISPKDLVAATNAEVMKVC